MKNFELVSKQNLFQGLSPDELKIICSIAEEVMIKQGDLLITEGEKTYDVYILESGTLEVLKKIRMEKELYPISILEPGEIVGELSFLDHQIRAATIRAKTDATLIKISVQKLEEAYKSNPAKFSNIYISISKNIGLKLRKSYQSAIKTLEERILKDVFFVNIVSLMSIYTFCITGLKMLLTSVPNTSYISFPLTVVFGILFILLVRYSHLSLSEFGISVFKWKQAVFDGLVLSIPLLILAFVLKVIAVHFESDYFGTQIFNPFYLIKLSNHNILHWIIVNAFYVFLIIPFQELIARGGLQALLYRFLEGKYRLFLSIVVSNLLFSAVHIFFGFIFAVVVFILGIYFGWIYSRTNNLISSWLAHSIIGVWILSVLGGPLLAA